MLQDVDMFNVLLKNIDDGDGEIQRSELHAMFPDHSSFVDQLWDRWEHIINMPSDFIT